MNRIKHFIKNNGLVIAGFIVMIIITFVAYNATKENEEMRRENLFRFKAEQAQIDINYRIDNYIQILKAAKGLMNITDTVTRTDWYNYVESLELDENYPGIQGLGYAVMLDPDQKDEVIDKIRKEGFKNFNVYPEGSREIYSSIIYLEPFKDRNLRAFGYDMYSDPTRQKAMTFALENNAPAISGKVELVQETEVDVQAGFLIYLPVYEDGKEPATSKERWDQIKGFVYYPFRMNDLMQATLGDEFTEMNIKIYDGATTADKALLYEHHPIEKNAGKNLPEQIIKTIDFGNHSWTILLTPLSTFGVTSNISRPLMVLLVGFVISLLLAFTLASLSYARRKAVTELQRTKEMEQKKDEFIGIASHELKTPLTSSKAYIELLYKTADSEDQKHLSKKAMESLNKLNILINDLLDVTRIQAGKLRLSYSEFNIHEAIDLSIENVLHSSNNHKIIKQGEQDPVIIEGDLIRLEQAIVNLLSNATKYSPDASEVIINVERIDHHVRVSIRDFGIGISKKHFEKLFDKFYRIEDNRESISGLGMGLFIAHEIIQRHNGILRVESEPGEGSIFYFELPLALK